VRLRSSIEAMPQIPAVPSSARRLPPGVKLLLVQGVAMLLWLALFMPLLGSLGVQLPSWQQAVGVGILAAGLGRGWGLSTWWLPINFLFIPGLLFMLGLGLAANWYLAAFAALLLVYWGVGRSQVPLYLSSRNAWRAVADVMPKDAVLGDLGSGLGGMLIYLSRQRPDGAYFGIENAPLPFLVGWLRARLSGTRCEMSRRNFWKVDLARFDLVYAYLSPVPMLDLWRKVQAEMRPGSLFISNTFAVPGVEAAATVQLDDLHCSTLYLYRL
jgi:hypothetical protein